MSDIAALERAIFIATVIAIGVAFSGTALIYSVWYLWLRKMRMRLVAVFATFLLLVVVYLASAYQLVSGTYPLPGGGNTVEESPMSVAYVHPDAAQKITPALVVLATWAILTAVNRVRATGANRSPTPRSS